MTSRQQAIRTVGQLAHFIEDALIRRGYSEFWSQTAQVFANRSAIGGKQYLKQLEPPRDCRRLQLLSRRSHYEQDNEQIFAGGSR